MATIAQIQANRLNSQKSTGPTSVDGKAVARFNALKHGMDAQSFIIPGEDPAELEALAHDYHEQFRPHGPEETFLVETLIRTDWNKRRLRRIETELFRTLIAEQEAVGAPANTILGAVYAQNGGNNALEKIFRRLETAQRTWFRALKELHRAQQQRQSSDPNGDGPALESLIGAASPHTPAPGPWPLAPGPRPLAPGPRPPFRDLASFRNPSFEPRDAPGS